MHRILILTDRPTEDDGIASFAVSLAHRLQSIGVAAVVGRRETVEIAASLIHGSPEGNQLLLATAPLESACSSDSSAIDRFLDKCKEKSGVHGITCETATTGNSLQCTADALARIVSFVVVSRETILDTGLLTAAVPIMICPRAIATWTRIVVATRNDAKDDALVAWGERWSKLHEIPLTIINLGSPAPRMQWSTVRKWLPLGSRRRHHEAVREGLASLNLEVTDLLLVDRQLSVWPFPKGSCEASADDLVFAAHCSLGVSST